MERQCKIGILGRRWGTPRWADDPMRGRDRRYQYTCQEVEPPSEGSLMTGGAERGDRNNSFVTISDIS